MLVGHIGRFVGWSHFCVPLLFDNAYVFQAREVHLKAVVALEVCDQNGVIHRPGMMFHGACEQAIGKCG